MVHNVKQDTYKQLRSGIIFKMQQANTHSKVKVYKIRYVNYGTQSMPHTNAKKIIIEKNVGNVCTRKGLVKHIPYLKLIWSLSQATKKYKTHILQIQMQALNQRIPCQSYKTQSGFGF